MRMKNIAVMLVLGCLATSAMAGKYTVVGDLMVASNALFNSLAVTNGLTVKETGYPTATFERNGGGGAGIVIRSSSGTNSNITDMIYHDIGLAGLILAPNGTEKPFIVNSSGRVGIGNTTPQEKLDVNGNACVHDIKCNHVMVSSGGYVSNATFYGDGSGLTNIPKSGIIGSSSFQTTDEVLARSFGAPSYSTLTNALHVMGAQKKTLILDDGEWLITDSLTIPQTLTLDIRPGSYLNVASGKLVTVLGQLKDTHGYIFRGEGSVSFDGALAPHVEFVRPEWYGAIAATWEDYTEAQATKNVEAFHEAMRAFNIVQLSAGVYVVNDTIKVAVGRALVGIPSPNVPSHEWASRIWASESFCNTNLIKMFGGTTTKNPYGFGGLRDVKINGRYRAETCVLLENANERSGIYDCSIANFTRYGIKDGSAYALNYTIEGVQIGFSSYGQPISKNGSLIGIALRYSSSRIALRDITVNFNPFKPGSEYVENVYSLSQITNYNPGMGCPTKGLIGIYLGRAVQATVEDYHCEDADIGLYYDSYYPVMAANLNDLDSYRAAVYIGNNVGVNSAFSVMSLYHSDPYTSGSANRHTNVLLNANSRCAITILDNQGSDANSTVAFYVWKNYSQFYDEYGGSDTNKKARGNMVLSLSPLGPNSANVLPPTSLWHPRINNGYGSMTDLIVSNFAVSNDHGSMFMQASDGETRLEVHGESVTNEDHVVGLKAYKTTSRDETATLSVDLCGANVNPRLEDSFAITVGSTSNEHIMSANIYDQNALEFSRKKWVAAGSENYIHFDTDNTQIVFSCAGVVWTNKP